MKRKIILLLITAFAAAGNLYAQAIDTATVIVSGGNAVVIAIPVSGYGHERTVSRSVGNTSNYIPIGTLKRPEDFAAFKEIAGDTVINGLKKLKKLSSDKELWNFIQSNPSYKEFSFAMVNLRFLTAIGWAYIDNTIIGQPKGTNLYYKVTDAVTGAIDTGSCITGPQPNEQKPLLITKQNTDSLIYLQWGYKAATAKFLPRYADVYRKATGGAFIKQPYPAFATRVKDSVYFGLSQHVKPNQEFTYYIQPVDFFNNAMNVRSDSVIMMSVNFQHIPPMEHVIAKDTTGGIQLSWKKPAPNLFLTSILIQRSATVNGAYTKIAVVALSDSSYLDKNVLFGQNYYYRLKMTGEKEAPTHRDNFSGFASALRSEKHNKPNSPAGLTVEQLANGVKLHWRRVNTGSSTLAGYYVYRSTRFDTIKMQLISRIIKDTSYVDSTSNLSRRESYTYAVKAVNAADVKSNYSATAQCRLPLGVDGPLTPAFISVLRNNSGLLVQWQNTKLTDNYIKGYILYKHKVQPGEHLVYDTKKKASEEASLLGFTRVAADVLTQPSYLDPMPAGQDQYEYAVAATDVLGAESGLSALAVENQKVVIITPPIKLNAINIDKKVRLNWLQADTASLTGYTIYRKEIAEKGYKKIASVGVKESTYTDNLVQPHKIYLYKVKSVGTLGESAGFAANSVEVY